MTEREQFMAVLAYGPLFKADAIVVLMGEDAEPRLEAATELFRGGGAPVIVVTGARDGEPRHMGAERGARRLLTLGVAPDRILVEPTAMNTVGQAHEVIEMAVLNEWKSLILVASAYHMPRAFLTFLRELRSRAIESGLQIIAMASKGSWSGSPKGMRLSRLDLLQSEYDKILKYRELGHVATFKEGLSYLRQWEL